MHRIWALTPKKEKENERQADRRSLCKHFLMTHANTPFQRCTEAIEPPRNDSSRLLTEKIRSVMRREAKHTQNLTLSH